MRRCERDHAELQEPPNSYRYLVISLLGFPPSAFQRSDSFHLVIRPQFIHGIAAVAKNKMGVWNYLEL
jgi:hypothetical protein